MQELSLYKLLGMTGLPRGSFKTSPGTLVSISYDFELSKFPVTNLLWSLVMGESFEGEPFLPKAAISWKQSVKFCAVLNERLGLIGAASERSSDIYNFGFRLPTEAEWLRGFGAYNLEDFESSQLGDYAWLRFNSGRSPHPVGLKLPNQWGLHDTLGNVWEWCWDWYESSPAQTLDPTGPDSGFGRVLRGAAYESSVTKGGQPVWRTYLAPSSSSPTVGFRLARTCKF